MCQRPGPPPLLSHARSRGRARAGAPPSVGTPPHPPSRVYGGVVIGSEISGNVRNVFAEDCKMDSPNLDRALRFKSNARRAGVLENVFVRNVEVGRGAEAVLTIDLYAGEQGPHRPVVRNVVPENVTSRSSPRAMWVVGSPGVTIDDISFKNCTFRGVEAAEVFNHAGSFSFENVTIEPAIKGRSLISPLPPAR